LLFVTFKSEFGCGFVKFKVKIHFSVVPNVYPSYEHIYTLHCVFLDLFAKECKTLNLGQKKALKLIDKGTGRFWRVESAGQKNAQVVTAIQIGSSATPKGSEKLPNCHDDKLEPDKQESFVI